MGGFLLVLHDEPVAEAEIQKRLRPSIQIFQDNGLRLKQKLCRDTFTLFLFARRLLDTENVLQFAGGDFMVATGTLFYRRKFGSSALLTLFEECSEGSPGPRDLRGHFCAMMWKSGTLRLFTDLSGIYHVFSNDDGTVMGSSFLAVAKATGNRAVRPTELYENIFCGPVQGTRTMIEGVSLLDCRRVYQFRPVRKTFPRPEIPPVSDCDRKEEGLVEAGSELLRDYMSMVKDACGDRVALALSGGFDSRLLQAAARREGMQPYTYVYGPDSAPDVRSARRLAAGEGIPLDVVNHLAHPLAPPAEFLPVLKPLFYFFDGLTTQGAVGSGQELDTRLARCKDVLLQLNGGGGESLRNFWRLPARPVPARIFAEHLLLGHVDFSVCTSVLDHRALIDSMESKIRDVLGLSANQPLPNLLTTLYARLFQHHWVGRNISNNATLTHALAPLAEPEFIALGDAVPHASRLLGRFEAAVIRRISPRFAAYRSGYGFSFDRPPFFLRRFVETAMVGFPTRWRRPVLVLHGRLSGLGPMPAFLQPAYIEGAFGKGRLEVERYLDIRRIRNWEVRNRALTMELLLREIT